jgi:hypothetical protein
MSNAWVAVDADGSEWVFRLAPIRELGSWIPNPEILDEALEVCIPLPKGSIKALIGRELSWADEAVEIK